jgi:transposase InsO family protein
MRFQFIEAHREEFEVQVMCNVLDVSRSGYYTWRTRPASKREMADAEYMKQVKQIFEDSHQTYGYERIWQELRDEDIPCGKHRVRRLMGQEGLVVKQTKRYKRTTKANPDHQPAPNLLAGKFEAERPDTKWCADITYIPTQEGWLYLAVILDLFSRRIVGWAMDRRMKQHLVSNALQMALRQRQPVKPLIHHSDRGSQYTSYAFQELLTDNNITASMSGRGNCYDNAPVESFFGTLKAELVHHAVYRTRQEAMTDIFFYIEGFYNRTRRHSTLGYLSPTDFEAAHAQQFVFESCNFVSINPG